MTNMPGEIKTCFVGKKKTFDWDLEGEPQMRKGSRSGGLMIHQAGEMVGSEKIPDKQPLRLECLARDVAGMGC